MNNGVCKGCDKRYVGCHSVCDVYLDWNEKHIAEREAMGEERKISHLSRYGASPAKSHKAKNPATFKEGRKR